MKQERVILSFIMVLIGLLAAGVVFYFYQSTKVTNITKPVIINALSPTPSTKPTIYLTISKPLNESVLDSNALKIEGTTNPNATLIIITDSREQVLQPSPSGNFSAALTLLDGQNLIKIYSFLPNGEEASDQLVVTYSKENF